MVGVNSPVGAKTKSYIETALFVSSPSIGEDSCISTRPLALDGVMCYPDGDYITRGRHSQPKQQRDIPRSEWALHDRITYMSTKLLCLKASGPLFAVSV